MKTEPLVTIASITAAATAVIAALVAFGVNLDDAQTEAIMGLVAVAAPLIVAAVARRHVSSPATVDRIRATAAPVTADGE